MSFEKLLKALEGGNTEEAKNYVVDLQKSFEDNVKEINRLEGKATEAIQTRDKTKSRLRELASSLKLGVEDLTTEKLNELLQNKSSGGGDNSEIEAKYQAQIEELSKQFEDKENTYKNQLADANNKYNDTLIDRELLKHGVSANVANEKALTFVTQMLKDGATIEEGNIVYRDGDGLTLRNDKGKPLSIVDKLEQLQSDEGNAFLFKAQTQQGGDAQPNNGSNGGASTMTMEEAIKLPAAKYDEFIAGGGEIVGN